MQISGNIFFDQLTQAYVAEKLNQTTSAGSLETLNNIPIMHKSEMLSFWIFKKYRHYFFAYPFYVNNVYIRHLISRLSSKMPVVRVLMTVPK